jgi:FtsH-binding integral membrane protein
MMGFILASGVLAYLKGALPNLDAAQLHLLAERIAAGNAVSVPGVSNAVVHEALASGFGRVMLYGGIGVWIMSAVSFAIFNARTAPQARVQCSK